MQVDDEFARRAGRLKRAGETLFGEGRWQSPLAELLGVAQPTVAKIHGGSKDLSADLEDRLGKVCIEQADLLSRRSMELARLAVEIAHDQRRGLGRLRQSPSAHEREVDAASQPLTPKSAPAPAGGRTTKQS